MEKRINKIVNEITNQEITEFIKKFEEFIKKEKLKFGFHNQIGLIEYVIAKNNKNRNNDKAVLKFEKLED